MPRRMIKRFERSPVALFHYLVPLLLILVAALPGGAVADQSDERTRPNVLFIAVDDMNDWIQLLDEDAPIRTPNLRRLASRGTLFTRAYCASPACNPSRAAILTGKRPSTTGVYGNRSDWRRAMPNVVTLMQHFMAHGYRVEGAGKIFHHALASAFHDDASFHDFQKMPDPPDAPMPKAKLNGLGWFGSPNTDWGRWPEDESRHVDVRTVDYCVEKLKGYQDDERPFFLAAGVFRPHMPFFAPSRCFEEYPLEETVLPRLKEDDLEDIPSGGMKLWKMKRHFWDGMTKAEKQTPGAWREAVQAYQACATFADEQIGRLIDSLDASDHADNTIIVLWSDHGYHLGEKEHWEKFALWEKTTHVPYIVVAPGVGRPGGRCDRPVDLMSVYPTLIELCGMKPPHKLDGVSVVPLLKDPDAEWERPAVMTYLRGNHAVRDSRWRYIRYADGSEELYDHNHDPYEWDNVAGQPEHRETIERLRKWLPKKNARQVADLRK